MNTDISKIAAFDARIKYYDFVYEIMKSAIGNVLRGEFEQAFKLMMCWHDILPMRSEKRLLKYEEQYVNLYKDIEKELKTIRKRDTYILSSNNRIDRIEMLLFKMHSLLQEVMHIKGMHIPTKEEYDPSTTIANVRYD